MQLEDKLFKLVFEHETSHLVFHVEPNVDGTDDVDFSGRKSSLPALGVRIDYNFFL